MSDRQSERTVPEATELASPSRSEREATQTREGLEVQILADQETTLDLMEKFDAVKNQVEQMEADNRYMQAYIGELVAQTRATGPTSGSHSAR